MNETIYQYKVLIERLNINIKRMNYRNYNEPKTKYVGTLNEAKVMYMDLPILNDIFSELQDVLRVYEKELNGVKTDFMRLNEIERDIKKIVKLLSEMSCIS